MSGHPRTISGSTTRAALRSRCILVTGFGPFPGAPFNPSGPLVQELAALRRPAFKKVRLVPHVFATSYESVDRDLPALIAHHRPDAILMFGLAARSKHVRIEMQARNSLSAFPDAAGYSAAAPTITPGAQTSRPILAPRTALLRAARACGIPARLSHDAGGYLCNYLYWRALEAAERPGGPDIVAFIHIPNVRRPRIRKTVGRGHLCDNDLTATGEAILLAMISAVNRGDEY